MSTKSQLADFISAGLQTSAVEESALIFISSTTGGQQVVYACVLGLAIIGRFQSVAQSVEVIRRLMDLERSQNVRPRYLVIASSILGIAPELATDIDGKHADGYSALEIIDWLRSE
jgi:hypothetical protein